MTIHFLKEIEIIKAMILDLGTRVEESVRRAADSVQKQDSNLAREVMLADDKIDEMEVQIEEECLKVLALHQPVAADLRFIVAVLKINNDLERIGDLAVNIAERTRFLSKVGWPATLFDFSEMAECAQDMLKRALDALVNLDDRAAHQVCIDDDQVDDLNREVFEIAQRGIRERPEDLEALIHIMLIARHLERVADHATNLAEDVIYMTAGEIVRHRAEDFA